MTAEYKNELANLGVKVDALTASAGLDYILNNNNTITADISNVNNNDSDADESFTSVTVGLDNTTGAFTNTASVTFGLNDYYS